MIRRVGLLLAGVAVLAALFTAGIGGRELVMRLTSDHDETIQACRNTTTGALRVVSSADDCRSSEQPLSWSVEGPAGPTGATGPAGPPGPPGPAGEGSDGDWLRRCDVDEQSTFDCSVEDLRAG